MPVQLWQSERHTHLRVTEAEAELFKAKAKEAGCKTISEYIRVKCIDGIATAARKI